MKGKKTINQKIETPGNKKTKPISVSDISPLGKMTRKLSPKQAELSSDTTGTRDESSVDIFSSQLLPGAEQGLTPDTVQQYPHQTAGVGSMNERVHPMPYAAGVNYPQGYFPPSENQYGAFYQAQQALPLFKSYFSSIGYPNQIRPKVFTPRFAAPVPDIPATIPSVQKSTDVQYTQTDTIRQTDGPLVSMVRLVPIEKHPIPMVLLVKMHLIKGT